MGLCYWRHSDDLELEWTFAPWGRVPAVRVLEGIGVGSNFLLSGG